MKRRFVISELLNNFRLTDKHPITPPQPKTNASDRQKHGVDKEGMKKYANKKRTIHISARAIELEPSDIQEKDDRQHY